MRRVRGIQSDNALAHVTYRASLSTSYYFGVPAANLRHKAAVQQWMMTDGYNPVISAAYFADCLAPMDGVIFKARWVDLETSQGVYNTSRLDAAVDYCAARGKRLILRLWFKSYTDANDPPLSPPIPAYIVSAPATYGGASGSGGMRKSYTYPTWAGWAAMLDNSAVRDRMYALIDYIGNRYKGASAFFGWGLDESQWGAAYPLPAELTTATVAATNIALHERMASAAPGKLVIQFANFLDSGTVDNVLDHVEDGKGRGWAVGVTDVFSVPTRAVSMQPSYYALPDPGRFTIVCSEGLTFGSNDAGLSARMDDAYRMCAMLGADICAWTNIGGTAGAFWPHVLRVTGRS